MASSSSSSPPCAPPGSSRCRGAAGRGGCWGAPDMAPLLELRSVTKRFGGLTANKDISLTIDTGEIVGLIGPNGAGKTTLFNCLTGYMHPEEGTIVFAGADITHARPDAICGRGVARTWQLVRTFGRMSVLDNVICGALK